jgi:hypothetical protein
MRNHRIAVPADGVYLNSTGEHHMPAGLGGIL